MMHALSPALLTYLLFNSPKPLLAQEPGRGSCAVGAPTRATQLGIPGCRLSAVGWWSTAHSTAFRPELAKSKCKEVQTQTRAGVSTAKQAAYKQAGYLSCNQAAFYSCDLNRLYHWPKM
jgi:hypothetical protein